MLVKSLLSGCIYRWLLGGLRNNIVSRCASFGGAGIGQGLMMTIRASIKVKSRLLAKVRLGMTNLQEGP
jgi:hypothetical protein